MAAGAAPGRAAADHVTRRPEFQPLASLLAAPAGPHHEEVLAVKGEAGAGAFDLVQQGPAIL